MEKAGKECLPNTCKWFWIVNVLFTNDTHQHFELLWAKVPSQWPSTRVVTVSSQPVGVSESNTDPATLFWATCKGSCAP